MYQRHQRTSSVRTVIAITLKYLAPWPSYVVHFMKRNELKFLGISTHQSGKKNTLYWLEVLLSSHQILIAGLYLDCCENAEQCSLSTCKDVSQSGGYIAFKLPVDIVTIFINNSLFRTGTQFKETVTWKAGSLHRANHFGVVKYSGKIDRSRKSNILGGGIDIISINTCFQNTYECIQAFRILYHIYWQNLWNKSPLLITLLS